MHAGSSGAAQRRRVVPDVDPRDARAWAEEGEGDGESYRRAHASHSRHQRGRGHGGAMPAPAAFLVLSKDEFQPCGHCSDYVGHLHESDRRVVGQISRRSGRREHDSDHGPGHRRHSRGRSRSRSRRSGRHGSHRRGRRRQDSRRSYGSRSRSSDGSSSSASSWDDEQVAMVYGVASGAEYSAADDSDYHRRQRDYEHRASRGDGRHRSSRGRGPVAERDSRAERGGDGHGAAAAKAARPSTAPAGTHRGGGADAGAGTSAAPAGTAVTGVGVGGDTRDGEDAYSSDNGFDKLKPAPEGRTRLTLTSKQLLSSTYAAKQHPLYYTAPTVPLEPPAVLQRGLPTARPQSAAAGARVSVAGTAAPLPVSPVKGRRGSAPAWSATRTVQASKSVQVGPPRYVASSGTQTHGLLLDTMATAREPVTGRATPVPSPVPSYGGTTATSPDVSARPPSSPSPADIHSIVTRGIGSHSALFRTSSVMSDTTAATAATGSVTVGERGESTPTAATDAGGWMERAKGPPAELWPGMHERDSLLPAVDTWLSVHNVGSLPANTLGMSSARKLRGASMRSSGASLRGGVHVGTGNGSPHSDDSDSGVHTGGAPGNGVDDFGNEDGAGDEEDAAAALRQRDFEAFDAVEPYSDPLVALRPSKRFLTRARTSISQCTRSQLRRFVELTPEKRLARILKPVSRAASARGLSSCGASERGGAPSSRCWLLCPSRPACAGVRAAR